MSGVKCNLKLNTFVGAWIWNSGVYALRIKQASDQNLYGYKYYSNFLVLARKMCDRGIYSTNFPWKLYCNNVQSRNRDEYIYPYVASAIVTAAVTLHFTYAYINCKYFESNATLRMAKCHLNGCHALDVRCTYTQIKIQPNIRKLKITKYKCSCCYTTIIQCHTISSNVWNGNFVLGCNFCFLFLKKKSEKLRTGLNISKIKFFIF